MPDTLRIGSLCSGYGGLELGVQAVYGGTTAWVSDIDKGACKILAHRFPDVPNIGDMTAVDWAAVEPVDLICGGTPCQDLSHAGKRAGMTEGTRSNLWVAMREAIAVIRPRYVVWENVRGAYSAPADSAVVLGGRLLGPGDGGPALRALGRVLGDLSDLGYDASWHGLRAADIGAPHGRFRVFVVATDAQGDAGRVEHGDGEPATDTDGIRRGQGWPTGPGEADRWRSSTDAAGRGDAHVTTLPTPTARDWKNVVDPTKTAGRMAERGQPLGEVVVNALLPTPRAGDGEKGGPNQRGSSGDLMLPSAVHQLLPTPAVNDMGEGKTIEAWDAWTERMKAEHGNGNGHGASLSIEAQRLLPTPMVGSSSPAAHGQISGQYREMAEALANWGQYAAAIHRWETLTRPAPPPTETGPKGNPRLSAAFSEWMMGLPAGWVTDVPGITRNEALKALGNGVVPQQAAHALRSMALGGC